MEDAEKLKSHVGKRIAELRERQGLTQANVSEVMGTTVPNLQRIEYGMQNITIETLTKIANAIGVKVRDFFGEIEDPKARRGRGRPKKNP
ncbi:MAG: helix-turn-helix transcriptional regulator [Labilithrix sp.]